MIWETTIYDGKVWRVLNLNTGVVYSTEYVTETDARHAIPDGEERNHDTVRLVHLHEIREGLRLLQDTNDAFDARVGVPLKKVQ